MQIDQTNVTVKIDDTNPFGGSEPNELDTEDIEDELRHIKEEKRLIKEENKKIEEAKQKLLEEDKKRKEEEEKRRIAEEEIRKKTMEDEKKRLEDEKKRLEEKREREEREKKEEEERRIKEALNKYREDYTKPSSSSTPLSLASLSTNDDDQIDLISSMRKLIEKNRKVKSLQRTLMEVIEKLHNTLVVQHTESDLEQRAQAVLKSFDEEFSNLLNVAEEKAHISHDSNLFSTICQNIKNDLVLISDWF